jgi:predicted secreted protein/multisubunit Na+/H+ antiporter MnhC subunit
MPWWGWALLGWTGLALVVAPLLGLALREADRRERVSLGLRPAAPVRPVVRRRIPLSPLTVGLLLTGVVLEAVGFVVRTSGNERGAARLWSMDLPLSVPRMYVAALFFVAALAALAGALRYPGRRPWWAALALVGLLVGEVKAGGTVHTQALAALGLRGHPLLATVLSGAVAGAVLCALWWLSRDERRDRRRMLIALGLYAVASVGLSGVSALIAQSGGSPYWVAAATFVEETGEAFGAVAVLTAVLVGVAPRLVLPVAWVLRRQADAETIDAPGSLPHPLRGRTDLRG